MFSGIKLCCLYMGAMSHISPKCLSRREVGTSPIFVCFSYLSEFLDKIFYFWYDYKSGLFNMARNWFVFATGKCWRNLFKNRWLSVETTTKTKVNLGNRSEGISIKNCRYGLDEFVEYWYIVRYWHILIELFFGKILLMNWKTI